MKKTTKLALLATLTLTLAGLTAQAQTEPAAPQPPQAPPGPPAMGRMLPGLLDKYDVNKDGILDQQELANLKKDAEQGKLMPPGQPPFGRGMRGPGFGQGGPGGPGFGPGQPPKEVLDKYDTNQDGKLDENERAALHKDIQEGKVQPPFGRGQRSPGFGPPPTAQGILEKFDADKDGKLDATELNAFLKSMPRGRGPMGGAMGGAGGPPPQDGQQQ